MTERVGVEIGASGAERPVTLHQRLDSADPEARPAPTEEERLRGRRSRRELGALLEIARQALDCLGAHRYDALLLPLAEHPHLARCERYVVHVQAR